MQGILCSAFPGWLWSIIRWCPTLTEGGAWENHSNGPSQSADVSFGNDQSICACGSRGGLLLFSTPPTGSASGKRRERATENRSPEICLSSVPAWNSVGVCSGNTASFTHGRLRIKKIAYNQERRQQKIWRPPTPKKIIIKKKTGWLPLAYLEIRFTCGKAILEMTRKGAFTDKPLIHEMTIGFCGWGSTQEHIGAANLTSCKHHIWIQEGKQESVIISFSHGNWNLQLKEPLPKKFKVLPQVWPQNISQALSLSSLFFFILSFYFTIYLH